MHIKLLRGKHSGKYVLLGDADCTYDFRKIDVFIEKLENNIDFVVGNRFKEIIEKKQCQFITNISDRR
jgi:hypothetical protein